MPSKQQYVALSRFRRQLARFLRVSTRSSRAAGLTMTQYVLLLHVAGRPDRDWASVGELAELLQASPHGTLALVDRCVAAGLVRCRENADDRRRVEVRLTAKGARLLDRAARLHRDELQAFRHVFRIASVNDGDGGHAGDSDAGADGDDARADGGPATPPHKRRRRRR